MCIAPDCGVGVKRTHKVMPRNYREVMNRTLGPNTHHLRFITSINTYSKTYLIFYYVLRHSLSMGDALFLQSGAKKHGLCTLPFLPRTAANKKLQGFPL